MAHTRVMLHRVLGCQSNHTGDIAQLFPRQQYTWVPLMTPHACSCTARRFTGHVHGKQETFGRSPVMCELETAEPPPPTLLFARTRLPPVVSATDAKRDPCNQPAVYLPNHNPANLWPK